MQLKGWLSTRLASAQLPPAAGIPVAWLQDEISLKRAIVSSQVNGIAPA